ncbi:MAG: hypothetical protein B7Z66_05185 [Chromatiales bacterium 21-64-14]|nr:MAG: hypothetical protein B7Z66_05185 [Chromatiales bacterium 21-64-14]HQU17233.1 DUF3617 domain-containing protein [Gammaproteobacteria bacterium]
MTVITKMTGQKMGIGAATSNDPRPNGDKYSTCSNLPLRVGRRIRAIQYLVVGLSITVVQPAWSAGPDLKPGLWEYATSIKGAGVVMPDLSKLPPEQREKFRKALIQMETEPRNIALKICLTEEKIKSMDFSARKKSPHCTQSVTQDGSGKWTETSHCVTDGQAQDSVVKIHVLNPTHVTSAGQVTVTRGAQVHKSEFRQDGKWVSADCGGVK